MESKPHLMRNTKGKQKKQNPGSISSSSVREENSLENQTMLHKKLDQGFG